MHDYLVSHHGRKRLIRVECKEDLLKKSCDVFGTRPGNFVMRAYLPAFDDMVDVRYPNELPDTGKIFLFDIRGTAEALSPDRR